MANTDEIGSEIYQLKVTVLGTNPPIWRCVLAPSSLMLDKVHRMLQIVFGWEDCHMHEFSAGKRRFGKPDPDFGLMGRVQTESERRVSLAELLEKVRSKAIYTYDFGDGWDHQIVLEKILERDPALTYPLCMGGERNGPPEDCGGIPGYYNLLDAIQDPKHPDHDDLVEWVGEYDPEAFSIDSVNRKLKGVTRKPKK